MAGMQNRRWLNPTQPQTLQIAVFLLYINAAFAILRVLLTGSFEAISLVTIVGGVAAGSGIANERKWSYALALVIAFLPLVLRFLIFGNPLSSDLIVLMFDIALIALLVHPQSREYQRIWFK